VDYVRGNVYILWDTTKSSKVPRQMTCGSFKTSYIFFTSAPYVSLVTCGP